MKTVKTHAVRYGKHWAIDTEKTDCPECQASSGFNCIAVARDPRAKTPMVRMPMNVVHARRVLAAGHDVKVI